MSTRAHSSVTATGPGRRAGGLDPWAGAMVVIALVGFAGFAVLTWLVAARMPLPLDQQLLAQALRWQGLAGAWRLVSEASNLPLIAIGVALVAWLWWKHRRREAILVIVTLALVTVGSEAVKQLVARPRPPGSDTVVPGVIYSYPSGHELESVTLLGIVALLAWRSSLHVAVRAAIAAAVGVFVLLVAVARVAIDAHYPSDVLAGFLAGIAVLALFALLTRPDHDGRRMAAT